MYKTENYGLFLGFMTMPFGKEKDFKEHEVDNLFAQYKEDVHSYLLREAEEDKIFTEYLFKPKVYCLFGKFDLAVLSLVDSFGLATRSFHPFSPLMKKKLDESNEGKAEQDQYTPQNYTFHVVSGLSPDLKMFDPQEDSLLERAKATFLNLDKVSTLPFIGISSFKFNNALVTGGGGEVVDLAVRAIQVLLMKKQKEAGANFNYIISYSFSWHELSILFFSDSYNDIVDEVFKIRELTVQDLNSGNEAITTRYKQVVQETLLHKIIEEDPQEENLEKVYNAHLFVHSNTVLGYDSDIFIEDDDSYDSKFNEELTFQMRWDLKPGHLSAFLTDLEACEDVGVDQHILDKGRVTAGRGDYAYVLEENAMTNFRKMLKVVVNSDLKKHIRTVTTIPEFTKLSKKEGKPVQLDKHFLVHDQLAKYQFTLQQIVVLRTYLKKLRIPKIIQEKVNNMYTIYNDGISDPILYNYFIELRPYLNEVLNLLEDWSKEEKPGTVNELTDRLNSITSDYEMAYQNRFGQSYIMNEITDYNLMFNGGIQQLVSLFDGAYKSLASLFGEGEYSRSMAYVAGISNTTSELLSVRLNYFHLYQPEFFAATATHEAVNFTLYRYERDVTQATQGIKAWFSMIDERNTKTKAREQLHYFLVDILTYYTTFAEDFELFSYWTWSVYLQMGIAYNTDGKVHQKQFNLLFTRMFLLAEVTRNSSFFQGAVKPPFSSADRDLQAAWEQAFPFAEKKVKKIFDEHTDLLRIGRDLAVGHLYMDIFQDNDDPELFKKAQKALFRKQDQQFYRSNIFQEVLPLTRQDKIKELAELIQQKFREGEVFLVESARQDPKLQYAQDSFFLQALLLAYLKLIKDLSKHETNIVPRSKQGGQILREAMQAMLRQRPAIESDLWFDPHGGMFTTNTSTRVAYLKYRSVFLKSLWNFSAKRKIKLFDDILGR